MILEILQQNLNHVFDIPSALCNPRCCSISSMRELPFVFQWEPRVVTRVILKTFLNMEIFEIKIQLFVLFYYFRMLTF